MPYFDDARAVYGHIGYLLRAAVADEDLAGRLRSADAVVQFDVRRPDARITVALRREGDLQVDLGETDLRPDVVLAMDGDTAHGYWQGQVNMASALAKGQIKAHGPVAAILRLVPLGKDLFPRYRDLVEGGDLPPLEPAAGKPIPAESAPEEEPAREEPAPKEEPAGEEPAPGEQPAAEEPAAEEEPPAEPAAEEPAPVEEPAAEAPAAEVPAPDEPPAAGEGAEEVVPAAGEGEPAEAPGPAPGVRPDEAG